VPAVVDAPGAAAIVRTASADYPVYAGWGELERLGEHVKRATGARRAFLVSDDGVMSRWGEAAVSSLRAAGLETVASALPHGDTSKNLASAGKLYGWLAEQRAERRDAIVALGGGMVGDLAGFVGATYMRGVPVVQAPTTLLGMVDASIGGKTAVNHAGVKNIVGAFYQPGAVVADVATLKTLGRRELVEGLGEVIKHAFIADGSLLGLLESRLDDLLGLDEALTVEVVRRNVQIKASVVGQDERETGGVREFLNYGHTLGHAFEAAGDYKALLHGEAVAVGMMAACTIGVRMGLTPPALLERQRALLERAGLPLRPPSAVDAGRVREALALDKKVVAGRQRWVLLEDAGRPVIRDDVPVGLVEETLRELLN
jgi:3-dehydroquinate synthase